MKKLNGNNLINKKVFAKRIITLSLAASSVFTAVPMTTLSASAEEASFSFIPFRSDYLSYLSDHSSEASSENIYIWCKMLGEQINGGGQASAGNWFSTYHSEVVLPGGKYLSDSAAASQPLYKTDGTSNPLYDQLIANLITANKSTFLNSWINGYSSQGVTYLNGTQGKQSFINFFDKESSQFPQTSNAIVEYTKTTEGMNWLNQYSYAKTGNNENTVGVTLLKMLCVNWDSLNANQINWCKAYLPYMLQNYAAQGNNAIASSSKNPYLYDFMARSVNGAQYTGTKAVAGAVSANGVSIGNVAAGTSLQQEFFNYVVASKEGVGTFLQNTIGGGTFTAYTPQKTVSGISLANVSAVTTLFAGDADVMYDSAHINLDYDWWAHGLWLTTPEAASVGKQSANSSFNTAYKLIMNNSTAKAAYLDWTSRFKGKSNLTISWNSSYLTNYSYSGPGDSFNSATKGVTFYYYADGHTNEGRNTTNGSRDLYFTWKCGTSTGEWGNNTSWDPGALQWNGQTLMTGWNMGRVPGKGFDNVQAFAGNKKAANMVFNFKQPIDYGANTITVSFTGAALTCSGTSGINVYLIGNNGGKKQSLGTTGNAVFKITDDEWKTNTEWKLKVEIPNNTMQQYVNYGIRTNANTMGLQITGLTEKWDGAKKCVAGHTWNDWTYSYATNWNNWSSANAENKETWKVTVSHTCKANNVHQESEIIRPVITSDSNYYYYTYTPTSVSLAAWTEKVARNDIGSGTQSYTSFNNSNFSGAATKTSSATSYVVGHNRKDVANIIAASEASGLLVVNTGIIKSNVKSISVDVQGQATVQLRNSNGLIATGSGKDTVTLDVSKLSVAEKKNCYLQISYRNSESRITYVNETSQTGIITTGNASQYAGSVTTTASVKAIKINY
ncbi:MAG: hypothetical protein E7272_12675 [Pseudobutyrivibrio ruminis]|uniref:Uncharacterized protein n=1 Tax=Pseudobutyrivibrio ruminis TaxID=46206 RepID=A0A927UEL0_9FIRM|nr:hypothetical protein [Pseudobutyrivibrio ruminis]